jgi:AraC-like DNA-binding protein
MDGSDPHGPETIEAPSPFELVSRAPSFALRGVVSGMMGYRETTAGHFRQTEAASLHVPLIISFGDPFAIGLGHAPAADERFGSFAAGLFLGPVMIESSGGSNCLQINFTPLGARRVFGMPMSELADRMVDLGDTLGPQGPKLRQRLGDLRDWPSRFDLAERFVARRLAEAAEQDGAVEWAFDRILATGGRARIGAIATRIGWSRKHLASRFRDHVGLPPKSVARIIRFNRARTLPAASGWADVAAACGYADQAHLVREFRELAGQSPTGLR